VYRTLDIDPAKWLDALARRRPAGSVAEVDRVEPAGSHSIPRQVPRQGLVARLKRLVVLLLTGIPDSHVFWLPFAFVRGSWLLLVERVDVIYSTSPPHSTHLVAVLLAQCFRKPCVVDFRDPWDTGSGGEPARRRPAWAGRMERWMKRKVVQGAAHVFTVSSGECADLRREFGHIEAARFSVITNGYDPADFAHELPAVTQSRRVTLTHAGTIYAGAAGRFFDALRELLREEPDLSRRLCVRLVGDVADEYQALLSELQRSGVLEVHGLQSHQRALGMMQQSDALLILLGAAQFGPAEIPAKVFEYMHAGKPIITVARPGELVTMVERSGLGIPLAPDDIHETKRTLRSLYEDAGQAIWQRSADRAYVAQFERRGLTERVAAVLNAVAARPA
jgi:glycosyltransferase involved in cell wall biosynthesis